MPRALDRLEGAAIRYAVVAFATIAFAVHTFEIWAPWPFRWKPRERRA